MATLAEVRAQYPQYADLSDAQLADGLYAKFYSDMPRAEFNAKVGIKPESWSSYFKGLGREAVQGATFDFGDELGLTDAKASESFAAEHPIASTVARVAGGVAPFVAGPGAGLARLAIGSTLRGTVGRSAALGAGAGALAGAGAGEDLEGRLEGAATGAAAGGALGAAVPPVIAAAGRMVGAASPVGSRVAEVFRRPSEPPLDFNAGRRSPPIEGARFVNDMSPEEIANAQTRALGAIRYAMLRSGRSVDDVERELARLTEARTYGTSGAAQDATLLADLDPALQRLAGTLGRQSPEAARDIQQVLAARQTGVTPQGADAGRLAQRGLATRERFAEPMTGAQAEATLGSSFGAGQRNVVPTGHRGRVMDALKRALRIKDSDFHGHAANAGRTLDEVNAAMKAGAQKRYGALYRFGERVDLRPAVAPVLERWTARATAAQPPLSNALRRAVRLFQRRDGEVVSDIKNFDLYGKQYLDDEIGKAFRAGDNAVGRELVSFRDELFAALESASATPIRRIGALYKGARAEYSGRMRVQEIIERYKGAWKGDTRSVLEDYAALSRDEQKLARLGLLWGAEESSVGTDVARDITGLFRTPRAQELLSGIIQRTRRGSGAFADRPERFGRYLDFERRMQETRNTAVGGSPTAQRLQDDIMHEVLQASQSVQRFMDMFKGNQSFYQLGERLLTWAWDRAFGVGADAAREATRMLFTANPLERAAVLRQVAAIMPPGRMARFNDLMQRVQQTAASSIPSVGQVGAPTPSSSPSGPTFL